MLLHKDVQEVSNVLPFKDVRAKIRLQLRFFSNVCHSGQVMNHPCQSGILKQNWERKRGKGATTRFWTDRTR